MIGKVVVKRAGGYDPTLGKSMRDPTLDLEGIELEYLNRMTDVVLAYRPKPKTKAAKRRNRKRQRDARKG